MRVVNVLIGLVLLSFTSCKMFNSSELFVTDPNFTYQEFKPSEKEYKIQPFDKIDVKVYSNDGYKLVDMNQINVVQQQLYLVEFDGQIKLPSVGRVMVSGLTIREAEKALEDKYKEYIVNPFVLMNVTNKRVIVFSSGSSKGNVLEMKNDNYTLIEAIADAGGLSDISKSHKIKLLRGDLNNPQIFVFNIRHISEMQKANFVLQANDIIYVEARPRYSSRIVAELSPYLSLISSALLVYGLFLK